MKEECCQIPLAAQSAVCLRGLAVPLRPARAQYSYPPAPVECVSPASHP